jgi:hypothetical protein
MIVRQSSLSNAVATLATHGSPLTPDQVMALAAKYEQFVMGEDYVSADNLADDVIF